MLPDEFNLPKLLIAVKYGDDDAMLNIAFLYEEGISVKQDLTEAARWTQKAAELGNPYAQMDLADMYEKGLGVPQDHVEEARWRVESVRSLIVYAEHGDSMAQYFLADEYESGKYIEQNYDEAAIWYTESTICDPVDHGSGKLLAVIMYERSRGVPADDAESLKWYIAAPETSPIHRSIRRMPGNLY